MACFRIDAQVFDRLPEALFGAVVAKGIDNQTPQPRIAQRLEEGIAAIRSRIGDQNLKEYPAVLPYREAFQTLGINPNKFPSSIEALSKRVLKGNPLPAINPIVDIGNAMSLT